MDKNRSTIYKIIVLGLSFVLGAVILEFSARALLKISRLDEKIKDVEYKMRHRNILPISRADTYLGWSFNPSSRGSLYTSDFYVEYSINSEGLRDKEISLNKPSGEFRILALGESTVFGQGIDYGRRFTEIIEDALENVEVVNFGVWGFGADQSLLFLERDGFKFQPDLVILFVFSDFFERCKFISKIGSLKPRFIPNQNKNGIELQDLGFLKSKFKPPTSVVVNPNIKISRAENKFFMRSNFFKLLFDIIRMEELKKVNQGFDRKTWEQIKRVSEKDLASNYDNESFEKLIYFILQRYRAVCEKHGVGFILVGNGFYSRKSFDSICRDLNIPFLDLSSVLSYASRIRRLNFNIDLHYNAFAHKVIGEYVSGYLQKKYNLNKNQNYNFEFLGKWKVGL